MPAKIRKQVYLDPRHDRELKRTARATGKTEASIIREALDRLVSDTRIEKVVLEAVRGVRERSLSYWDTQIWAIARMHRISVVLSEDFQNGFQLEGVRFLNPLRGESRLEEWLESI